MNRTHPVNLEAKIKLDRTGFRESVTIVGADTPVPEKQYPFEFTIAVSTIEERPIINITDNFRGQVYTLPLDLAYPLEVALKELSEEYKELREAAQRGTHDPQSYASLKPHVKKIEEKRPRSTEVPRKFCLSADDPDNEMTPIISWHPTQYIPNGTAHYTGESRKGYWSLYLNGANGVILQTVEWDDEEGIKTMVESMSDPEALFSMLVLLDFKAATELSSRFAATNFAKSDPLPTIEISEIRSHLTNHELTTRSPNNVDSLKAGTLYIKSNGKKVPVAIVLYPSANAFNASYDASRARKSEEQSIAYGDWIEILRIERESNQSEWILNFTKSLTNTEWRILAEHSGKKKVVITKLNAKQWSLIDNAAQLALAMVKTPVRI